MSEPVVEAAVPPRPRAADLRTELPRRLSLLLTTCWLLPTGYLGLLAGWQLGRPELWQDELVTLDVANRSPAQILTLLGRVDAVHGGYYFLMHGWVALLGDSTTVLRLPSVLAMMGACACVALTAQRLFHRPAGLFAGFVFASVPTVLRFAQEARSYALVVCCCALATLLLLRALAKPSRWRFAAYGGSLTAIVVLNAVAVTILVGHALAVVLHRRRAGDRRAIVGFLCAAGLGVLAGLPILLLGSEQASRQISWITRTDVWPAWAQVNGSYQVASALLALAVPAWWGNRRAAAICTVVATAPGLAIWLASSGDVNFFFSKYLLFVLPAWAALVGGGLAAFRPWLVGPASLVALALLAQPAQVAFRAPLSHSWHTFPLPRVGAPRAYSVAAGIIAAGYQPGDALAFGRSQWWYLHDIGVKHYLPQHLELRDVFQARTAAQSGDLRSTECAVAVQCLGDAPRIWVVLSHPLPDPLMMFTADQVTALRQRYRTVDLQHPEGLTVALLARRISEGNPPI